MHRHILNASTIQKILFSYVYKYDARVFVRDAMKKKKENLSSLCNKQDTQGVRVWSSMPTENKNQIINIIKSNAATETLTPIYRIKFEPSTSQPTKLK